MADEVQIRFASDIAGALSGLTALKQAITAATAPVMQFKSAFTGASAAIQQQSAATRTAFQADLRSMVAAHAISLDEALGFDIEYTARRSAEERARLAGILASDAATLADKAASYGELVEMSARYSAQLAQDRARVAETARREASTIARPYRRAFDEIGAGWRSAVVGLVEGTLDFRTAALRVARSVERGFIAMAQTTLSRAAAGPVASLLGLAAPAAGQGVGDVLGNAAGSWVGGLVGQSATGAPQLGATTALTTVMAPLPPAILANTSALLGLTAAVAAGAAASTTSAATTAGSALASAGGIVSAGANAGGFLSGIGSFFGGIVSFLGFARGGVVPSAAGGWALPNFPGMQPAVLHAREMVLPAHISEGLQNMISQGGASGAGSGAHFHFHGPADAPSIERWFKGMMGRNPGVVRDMLRLNALTPRSI